MNFKLLKYTILKLFRMGNFKFILQKVLSMHLPDFKALRTLQSYYFHWVLCINEVNEK